jgi:hypothetical protein
MNFKKNTIVLIIIMFYTGFVFGDIETKNDPFSQKSFIPDISFIFDFSLINRDIENEDFTRLIIPGFSHNHSHEGHVHTVLKNGFNVSYGELALYSAVDPYFDLFTTFHLSEHSFEIEEVYIRTQKLPYGIQLKLGKFLSGFGRLNAQHAHFWSFFENPLIYRGIFGDHGYLEKGVQINWVAPTDLYILFGFEAFAGENENCFGRDGFEMTRDENGAKIKIEDSKLANSFTFYIKSSIDVGEFTVLYGVSFVKGKARLNHFEDEIPHGFYGNTEILGFDITAKYFIDSYKYLSFQTEYIGRNMSGTKYLSDSELLTVSSSSYDKKQNGIYSQFIYRFHKLWRTGIRYDRIFRNDEVIENISSSLSDKLSRLSLMFEYSPTEFSRIRFQYNNNKYQYLDNTLNNNSEFILNLNFSIGAHGAHSF